MAKNNRLQRFIKREKQFQQNNAFVNKPKFSIVNFAEQRSI